MLVGLRSVGDGLPSGGVLSKPTGMAPGFEEEDWENRPAWRCINGFCATSPAWNKEVARVG